MAVVLLAPTITIRQAAGNAPSTLPFALYAMLRTEDVKMQGCFVSTARLVDPADVPRGSNRTWRADQCGRSDPTAHAGGRT